MEEISNGLVRMAKVLTRLFQLKKSKRVPIFRFLAEYLASTLELIIPFISSSVRGTFVKLKDNQK